MRNGQTGCWELMHHLSSVGFNLALDLFGNYFECKISSVNERQNLEHCFAEFLSYVVISWLTAVGG